MLDLARDLVATPSLSGQEGDVVARCAAEMESLGFRVELDATGNALGVVGDGRPRLLFDAHADTVAPARGWTRDPYAAVVEDGRLYTHQPAARATPTHPSPSLDRFAARTTVARTG